jgi:hypothetical protein
MPEKVPPPEHVATWRNGKPVVDYRCSCRQTVPVVGVTTVAGAIAFLAGSGQHQH